MSGVGWVGSQDPQAESASTVGACRAGSCTVLYPSGAHLYGGGLKYLGNHGMLATNRRRSCGWLRHLARRESWTAARIDDIRGLQYISQISEAHDPSSQSHVFNLAFSSCHFGTEKLKKYAGGSLCLHLHLQNRRALQLQYNI